VLELSLDDRGQMLGVRAGPAAPVDAVGWSATTADALGLFGASTALNASVFGGSPNSSNASTTVSGCASMSA